MRKGRSQGELWGQPGGERAEVGSMEGGEVRLGFAGHESGSYSGWRERPDWCFHRPLATMGRLAGIWQEEGEAFKGTKVEVLGAKGRGPLGMCFEGWDFGKEKSGPGTARCWGAGSDQALLVPTEPLQVEPVGLVATSCFVMPTEGPHTSQDSFSEQAESAPPGPFH